MTSPYHLKIAPAARRQLIAADSKQRKLALAFLETLTMNPHPPNVKRIEGMTGLYSQKVQRLRFIYKVEEQEVLLLLVK